ncbi:MAG: ACP S-malonyltransferase [Herpetosiphonaceae bacterium]|nr:ACP S-malonyltransferase [Herpetosiphonaceae bacterium]
MSYAFIFPGQGSQAVGMGQDLAEQSSVARATFAEANAVLGFDLAQLCFAGDKAQLTATENAQPAILTASVALLRVLRDVGVTLQPALVAGHSLGEYSALVAAGSLDFASALQLVRRRGELMAAARDGMMAAILGMDIEPLAAICEAASAIGPCVIANQNAPGQLVISGATAAVQAAMEQAKAQGAKRATALQVSAAFHSPLMSAAAAGLAEAIEQTSVSAAQMPLIANSTAQPIQAAADIRHELVAQVTAPVRWIASVETFHQYGVTTVIEIGPGSVLTGLVKRIAPDVQRINLASLSDILTFQAQI